jgi:hypothetical protein
MGRLHASDDWHIPDELWAALGPLPQRPGNAPASGPRPLPAERVAPETLSRLVGCLVLVLAVGSCSFLMGSGWGPSDSASSLAVLVPLVAVCGALGGTLLAPGHRLSGWIGGAVAGSACAVACLLGRSLSGNPFLGGVVGLAGLVPGAGVYWVGRSLQRLAVAGPGQDRSAGVPAPQAPPPESGPRRVIYEMPVPEAVDLEAEPLAEALLALCRGQRRLFDRLLDYERGRHPYLSRAELLRLAIEHYENDNR